MTAIRSCSYSHPLDVLRFVAGTPGDCAIAVVTSVDGGGLRSPGAMMAVTADNIAGYVSNGCVDADVTFQARKALVSGEAAALRYGEGSPFMDVKLPCGGTLDLMVMPAPDRAVIRQAIEALEGRRPVSLSFSVETGIAMADLAAQEAGHFTARYMPQLRLRIAGTGMEPVALARLAAAADLDILVQSPEEAVVVATRAMGLPAEPLSGIPPRVHDDPWTACIFLFHDHGLENDLIAQALGGEAFYVGAVGSRRTQAARLAALAEGGVPAEQLARLHGPIGLIPSMRDASMLAISILAEVVSDYRDVLP